MKVANLLAAGLALALLASGCTIQAVGSHGKGKVIISSPSSGARVLLGQKPRLPPPGVHQPVAKNPIVKSGVRPTRAVARSTAPVRTRDLYADTDIASMSYRVENLNPYSGEEVLEDWVDPWWPYIDLYLTPGETYKVTVDVELTASAPGAAVGITRFGDEAVFTVDEWYDTYVDLYVKPSSTPVISPNVITGVVTALDPASGLSLAVVGSVSPAPGSVTPSDKFFYTSDAKLYYFNKAANAVYEWTNISLPLNTTTGLAIDASDIILDGIPNVVTVTLAAICPDPAYAGWFWAVGYDSNTVSWNIYAINLNYGTPEWYTYNYYTLDTDLTASSILSPPTIVPTGITLDNTYYRDIYISFYNHGISTDPVESGVLEYYQDPYDYYYYSYGGVTTVSGGNVLDWTSGSSIFTDVAFAGGRLYALASPLTAPAFAPGSIQNKGTSEVYVFDDYLNLVEYSPSPISTSDDTSLAASALTLPNRFAGPVQGGYLYISQTDFAAATTGSEVLSKVATDLSSISAP